MDVLDEQLHALVEQLGARAPEPSEVISGKARKLRRRRWLARTGVAGTLVAVLVFAVVALRAGGPTNRVETPGNDVGATTSSVPSPTPTTVGAPVDITTIRPTFDEQIARLERWYHNWPAEAPGGRPVLAAEWTFCDLRSEPELGGPVGIPGQATVEPTFASYSRLAEPLTEARIVDGCVYRRDRYPGDTPGNVPVETPAEALPQYVLCATDRPGPNYTEAQSLYTVLRPAVVFGGTDCASAGFQIPPPNFIADLDRRRHVEIEMRAVPEDCPTADDALRWVAHVTQQELGEAWDVGSGGTTRCARPAYIDWGNHKVGLMFFSP